MNYGRYFKLNQVVSKVVDGVTVYDYTDLPAFFGPSKDTPQTPKYPVSVVITADAVRFRLHYSSYKYGPEEGNASRTVYRLNMGDVLNHCNSHYHLRRDQRHWQSRLQSRRGKISVLTTVHVEEVILELPFVDTHLLAENIRDVYDTPFPMSEKYGGRYFHQLLRRRYSGEKCPSEVETEMYSGLRVKACGMLSYSQLECMGVKDEAIYEGEEVKRFLRKLLLDFMFDLRHSDIFQLNPHYRQMLSGLMGDYYFASLLHKCEYYYQRELVNKQWKEESGKWKEERGKRNEKSGKRKVCGGERVVCSGEHSGSSATHYPLSTTHSFASLYCKDYFRAEDHWMHDIMDPRAEEVYKPADEDETWFGYPEEEMQALCFEKEGADALITTLDLRNRKKAWPAAIATMVKTHDHNRESASRWFLRRYDFKDVFRLHLSDDISIKRSVFALMMLVCLTFSFPVVPVEVPVVLTLAAVVGLLVVAVRNMHRRHERKGHIVASLHLVMPRLVAAIATAWITLALCYELVIAVYKMPPSWVVIGIVLVVMTVFSLYKINLFVPNASVKSKLGRMGLFLLLSYFISIVIGFVMVACVGEPFLMEYLQGEGYCIGHAKQMIDSEGFRHGMVIVFRGLTITFSFVAMFIGVFIQMIVGEEKQMTEM